MFKISVIGLGVVGNAIYETFKDKNIECYGYDKFKNGGIGNIEGCLDSDFIFLSLPTPYDNKLKDYDLGPLNDVLNNLSEKNFKGLVIIKSTINPGTTENFSSKYNLNLVHNPEFLTARNAKKDFENQTQIVLGKSDKCNEDRFLNLVKFYKTHWSDTIISICKSGESETMKLGCNTFYAVKIQYLTELYLICKKENLNFDLVKNMMILNGGISKNYTNIPGHDGSISYGGMCFPKDTNALCSYMEENNLPSSVLRSVIEERNMMRDEKQIGINN